MIEWYGFALRGAEYKPYVWNAMERRVLDEARRAEERGELVVKGEVVRTMYEGMPYVYVPVERM